MKYLTLIFLLSLSCCPIVVQHACHTSLKHQVRELKVDDMLPSMVKEVESYYSIEANWKHFMHTKYEDKYDVVFRSASGLVENYIFTTNSDGRVLSVFKERHYEIETYGAEGE